MFGASARAFLRQYSVLERVGLPFSYTIAYIDNETGEQVDYITPNVVVEMCGHSVHLLYPPDFPLAQPTVCIADAYDYDMRHELLMPDDSLALCDAGPLMHLHQILLYCQVIIGSIPP